MNQQNRYKTVKNPVILVAPLDWGLGHATRCVPIINELIRQKCSVIIAAEGAQRALLQKEFPSLSILNLPGYRVKYARSRIGLFIKLLRQILKIKQAITSENKWLAKAIVDYNIDAIISDNRYGLYHATVPSVFITHQLRVKSPLGEWSENLIQKKIYQYINRFSECWVPDSEGAENIAGELSHPLYMPNIPVCYIGNLSRFIKLKNLKESSKILIILSGPEPQRSMLEKIMVEELSNYKGLCTLVRGLPVTSTTLSINERVTVFNHLPADEINILMQEASFVIGRSGYSTVMDCYALQKKAIFIPTPGQTEQEYLATYLEEKGLAMATSQSAFSLQQALHKAEKFQYKFFIIEGNDLLANSITRFLQKI